MKIHNVHDRRFDWIGSWLTEPLVYSRLNKSDVGRTVIYQSHNNAEAGTLSSFRDGKVWARFHKGDTAAACAAEDLCFGAEPLDGDLERASRTYAAASNEGLT